MAHSTPQVLIPYDRRESITLDHAARHIGRSVATLRQWAAVHDLGRKVGGRWEVSRVALAMHLDGNVQALAAYLAGDRTSDMVRSYFQRAGIPIPGGVSHGA